MPDIRLQDYIARIKEMIRQVRLEEAMHHCQHILRHYPKHIETYSLLGEACLENEMYREAIEFFQRTLSADPENLIARVGLGVIYDEQRALPEAIWQLERAFELAPGNAEVRRELQRLYTLHEGGEKTRLRLTRGALGRLYSRNGLYERAIGEFNAVLRQDPDLPDIRVAQAEALWREGRKLEAVEVCLDILESLPNCLKANLILGEIWTRGGNEEAGEEKLSIARALDPENLVAQEMMGSDSPLPPEEVFIPELEAVPDTFILAGPAAVGVTAFDEQLEEAAEEGLSRLEAGEPWEEDEALPDWLRDVGVVAEAEPALPLETEEPALAELQPEDLSAPVPEWLQDLMDEEPSPMAEAPEMGEGEAAIEEAAVAETIPSVEETPSVEEVPDWLQELAEPKDKEPVAPPAQGFMLGDAVLAGGVAASIAVAAGMIHDEDEEPPEVSAIEEVPEVEELPEWLQDLEDEGVPSEEVAPAPVAEVEAIAMEEDALSAEEVPDWLRDLDVEEMEAEEVAPLVVSEVVEEVTPPGTAVPASLLALVEAGLLDEADLESAMAEMSAEELEAQRAEEVPSWLQDLVGEEPVLAGEEAEPAEEIPSPAWETLAEDVVAQVEEAPIAPEGVPSAEAMPFEEVPLPIIGVPEAEAPSEDEAEWLWELAEPVEEEIAPRVESPAERVPSVEYVAPMEVIPPVEDIAPSVPEARLEVIPPVEEVTPLVEKAALPVIEAPSPVAEAPEAEAPPVREEIAVPSRSDELLTQLKANPRDYKARLDLARQYLAEQDSDAALTHYEKLVSARKQLPEVQDDLEQLAKEDVDRARVYQLLGDVYMQQDQLDQALEMYRQARQSLTKR